MAHECNGWVPSYNDPDSGGYPDYRAAFAALIDATCGIGTWEDNPWVYAYTFDLTA
jgi:hypothetical protein